MSSRSHAVTKPANTLFVNGSQSQWDETRATRPSSHHSTRTSTRSRARSELEGVPENMQVALRTPTASSSRYTEDSQRTIRASGARSSHHDSRPSSHRESSHRDSTRDHGSKSTMFLVRDKSSGKELIRRATTASSRRDSPTQSSTRESTRQSSRHSTRDEEPRMSGALQRRDSRTVTSSRTQAPGASGPGHETRLERLEAGLEKLKVEDRPAPAPETKVVVVQAAPAVRYVPVYTPAVCPYASSGAYLAGYCAGRRGY